MRVIPSQSTQGLCRDEPKSMAPPVKLEPETGQIPEPEAEWNVGEQPEYKTYTGGTADEGIPPPTITRPGA